MPGTFVLIGRQMPRYSAGASGFMSYVSMWPGPPSSHSRMTDVSLLPPVTADASARARRMVLRGADAMPATPICRKCRRERPSQ